MKRLSLFYIIFFSFFLSFRAEAQLYSNIYKDNIKTVRLFRSGQQLSMPFIKLNSGDQLEMFFDDLDGDVKNYYYTFLLCNYDWTPANVMSMDYISGFNQNRISDYRFSNTALTRYTHYRVVLPAANSFPKKSGNYILKVYLDGDTSNVAFTQRMYVVDSKAVIAGQVLQPTTPGKMESYQKVAFTVDGTRIPNFDPLRQMHVTILQNFRWDNAQVDVKPTFIRGSSLEYNSESIGVFPAGKEWRWLDLRDFQLQTDRVKSADYNKRSTNIFLYPDASLADRQYQFYPDLDGMSLIEAVRGINPAFEGDYATVYFSYIPPNGQKFNNTDIYLFGQFTDYELNDKTRMTYNSDKGIYEATAFMKQGYYDYGYLLQNKQSGSTYMDDGNWYETENAYTILVYYRPFGGRTDELIGLSILNSKDNRQGFGF